MQKVNGLQCWFGLITYQYFAISHMKHTAAFLNLVLITLSSLTFPSLLTASNGLRVYFIGNSLTANIPLERLEMIFKERERPLVYGTQLGGGHRLEQHLVMRNHDNRPGEGTYGTQEPFGAYDTALRQYTWDALVLQPYHDDLDKDHEYPMNYPYHDCGVLQSADAFIDYAIGRTANGTGRWDLDHPNRGHVATSRIYIYATWPKAEQILEGGGTYSEYWNQPFTGENTHCREYFIQLVEGLNQKHPDLMNPVRIIPTGEVFNRLDVLIREGKLTGIEAFFDRNIAYFSEARNNNARPSAFTERQFRRELGILNFYADNVHLNDQPHRGPGAGTIGGYVAAITMYAALTGDSPMGLSITDYEQLDPELDSALIKSLQSVVEEILENAILKLNQEYYR